jgi:hypothetical protein
VTSRCRITRQRARAAAKLGAGLCIVGLIAGGCGGDDDTATNATPQQPTVSETPDETAAAEPTATPAPTADPAPDPIPSVSVAIECQRGESLSELDADLSRVTFVPDDAPDDTNWIDVVVTVENPTVDRVQVDPGFDVTLTDADGAEIATQPWVDETYDAVYADIAETDFILQPGQAYARRVVVFEGFSGPLFLRDAQTLALESLASCAVASEPTVDIIGPYEPPPGVTLALADCAAAPNGAVVEADFTVSNGDNEPVSLEVGAEVVDSAGHRLTTIGTFEETLAIPAGETVTRRLTGNASYLDLQAIADCEIYFAEPTDR